MNHHQQIVEETAYAIAKGLDASQVEWRRQALLILFEICHSTEEFTVNDFRSQIKLETHDNRAMGGIMRTGARLGWIKKSGRSIVSRVGHLSPLQIWQSLIYEKTNPTRDADVRGTLTQPTLV